MGRDIFDWLSGSEVNEFSGDPIADGLKAGRNTEYIHGEIPEYGDTEVVVSKFYQSDGDEELWTVKVSIPNGPKERKVTRHFGTQFPAEAVFEKLKRDYGLDEGPVGDSRGED